MGKWIKKIIQFVLFLGLGFFFVWLSVKNLTPSDIEIIRQSARSVLAPKPFFLVILSITVMALGHYFRALRSIMLINPLGYQLRKSTSFYAVMVSYLANLAFPRLGEVLRPTFIQRYDNVPFSKALGTIVTERVIDMIMFVLIMILAIVLNSSMLSELIVNQATGETLKEWMINKMQGTLLNGTLIALGLGTVAIILLAYFYREKLKKIPFFAKIGRFVKGAIQGLISIKDMDRPFLFVVYTLLIWVTYFLGAYILFFAFDFLSGLGLMAGLSVLAFGSIGFMIAQGGLGAYPLIVAGIFVLYGVKYEEGLAAAWVGWSAQTIMIIVVGFVSLLLASLQNRKTKTNQDEKAV